MSRERDSRAKLRAIAGVSIRQLPDDPDGILRISIDSADGYGGVEAYCVFRGDRDACIETLHDVLEALEQLP